MKNYYKVIRFLKKNLPIHNKITIRRTKMPKSLDGDCKCINNVFIIRIDKDLPEFYAIEVLTHELAHAIAWDKEGDVHGPHWGKAYSLVYRKLLLFTFDS